MFNPALIPIIAGMSTSIPVLCGGLLGVAVVQLAVRWLEGFLFD